MPETGWGPADDGGPADYFEADARPRALRRAGVLGQVAAAMDDAGFDLDVAHDVSGIPWPDLDSAAYVAMVLAEAEASGQE